MKNGFYITSKGKKVILEPSDKIDVPYEDIIELVIPDVAKHVYCWNNQLTELILPDGTRWVNCCDNKLKELICPDSVKYVVCWENQLTELIVPDDCKVKCDSTVKVITRTMYNRSIKLKAILK